MRFPRHVGCPTCDESEEPEEMLSHVKPLHHRETQPDLLTNLNEEVQVKSNEEKCQEK